MLLLVRFFNVIFILIPLRFAIRRVLTRWIGGRGGIMDG
jgi:NhaP-type Na+/H+ and K+/H+ antiporter